MEVFEDDEDERAVRVFISSTFLDMQRERDDLVRIVFPSLRRQFKTLGVEILEVDLRWGITQEQSESGGTLPILLDEIDRCRPFFIGLLGERYGWVPPRSALTQELITAYPSIATTDGCSVTELEIVHGVLSNPDTAANAIFFERERDWITTLRDDQRAIYFEESPDTRARLAALKQRIRDAGALVLKYSSPEALSPRLESALAERINTRYRAARSTGPLAESSRLHRAYARERMALHVGADRYISALDAWVSQKRAQPLMITGESGGGKSTLVANWLARYRGQRPQDLVFEHYLGATPDSADPGHIVRRLWEFLNQHTNQSVETPSTERALFDGLGRRLAQAQAFASENQINILMALDGLDKLSTRADLGWLPKHLPPSIRLLVSSLPGEGLNKFVQLDHAHLHIEALTDHERRVFVDATLSRWGRSLSAPRTARILAKPLSQLPLFLKTLLDELRVAGIERELDVHLENYLRSATVPELFEKILERLERDCGEPLVHDAMTAIWASRAGLEEVEIIAFTEASPLAWARLRNGLGDALRNQLGRITFSHDFLRQATEARYFPGKTQKLLAHRKLAEHFSAREINARVREELPYQLRGAQEWEQLEAFLTQMDHFLPMLNERGATNLLHNWSELRRNGRDIVALLCDSFEEKARSGPWSVKQVELADFLGRFLLYAGAANPRLAEVLDLCVDASRKTFGTAHEATFKTLAIQGSALRAIGDLKGAMRVGEELLWARRKHLGRYHDDTLSSMNNLAVVQTDLGKYWRALDLLEKIVSIRKRETGPESASTISAKLNLATALRHLGQWTRAEKLEQEVVDIRSRRLGAEHADTLFAKARLASTFFARRKLKEALALEEGVFEAKAKIFGPEHPETLEAMNNLSATLHRLNFLDEAFALTERVLYAQIRLLGENHPATLTSYNNIALLDLDRGNFEAARLRAEYVLTAREKLLGPKHPDTVGSRGNLKLIIHTQERAAKKDKRKKR